MRSQIFCKPLGPAEATGVSGPIYHDPSIFYQCQRCANCCRWPGEVVVTDEEVEQIAEYLEMPLYDFVREFTELRANRQGLTLIEKPNGECIFLEGNNCQIQKVKPGQCSGFPNEWNFPGWEEHCEAIPIPKGE